MKFIWRFRVLFFWLKHKGKGTATLSLLKNIAWPRFKMRAKKYIDSTFKADIKSYELKMLSVACLKI